jgi:hypothetical protein
MDNIKDGKVYRAAGTGETGDQKLIYMASHIGDPNGPLVGSMKLNLRNDRGSSTGAMVNEDYVATFHGEHAITAYTVTPSEHTAQDGTGRTVTSYVIKVRDSIVSTATDIYQMYLDGDSSSTDKIWINDDMKYSGLFRAGLSDCLSQELKDADLVTDSEGRQTKTRNVTYEWHRIEVPEGTAIPTDMDKVDQINEKESGAAAEYPLVTRRQTGDHYNISSSNRTATWLDVEAEEGSNTWRYGIKRAYYVKVTYVKGGKSHTYRSVPMTINHYGQLENGSFETPDLTNPKYNWSHSGSRTTGYLSNDVNGAYGISGGIWKTTAPSEVTNPSDPMYQADIEIANARNSGYRTGYNWQGSDGAKDGSQFAELNVEGAGALYQDIITHPNEQLSYWFSHRARGEGGGNKYDSMYLVIMPTKLAMTSGDNNSELKSQTELEKFIREHGGYDTNRATGNEDRITYSDGKNGILIRKVSSCNMSWHDIDELNGYTAKGGLTRFFFVAGKTASTSGARENTITNPFTMTITNKNAHDSSSDAENDALNGAKLQFIRCRARGIRS